MSNKREKPDSGAADLDAACELLDQVWEISPENRAAWLNEHCADDDLRREVESLLETDQDTTGFLDEMAARRASEWLETSLDVLNAGEQRIGHYRIEKRIARGGMGEVFLAHRDKGDFDQTVALKLAHRHIESSERRNRFLEEQQILARLEHPNIARLIDGGIWEGDRLSQSGRPYLVMEYVEGMPIAEYCAEHDLDLNDRLELFQTVCEAVHFAHQNLLIHRDIKPANILVSDAGLVKLVDFGIATALSRDATFAETRTPLMSPHYAAPEQIRGEPLTTATDVYSLGLVLYELVACHQPFDFENASTDEVVRKICETEPAPPSAPTGGGLSPRWAARVRGDLDTIVLKALGKDRTRRYPSARALAQDIRNFVEHKPVEAQPDSRRYRLSKFVSRHRWETAAAAIALVFVLGALVVATHSAREAKRALAQSRIEADKSAEVVRFLRDMFAAADPRQTGGEEFTVREVLESGRARIGTLSDQPEVQGQLLSELGIIYFSLGNYDVAIEALGRARDLHESILGPVDPAIAENVHYLSLAEERRGDLEAAEKLAQESLALRQAAIPGDEAAIGEAMDRLGTAISGQGRYQEAEPWILGAVEKLTQYAGELDPRTLTALHNLAWLQGRLDRNDQAVNTYRKVVELGEIIHGPNDPDLLVSRDSLAVALRRQGELEEAEVIFRDVLARRLELLGEPHWELGYTYHNLARLLVERDRQSEAIELYQRALDNWSQTLGPEHPNMGVGLSNLGKAQDALGKFADAETSWRRAVEILDGKAGYEDRLSEVVAELARLQGLSGSE